MRGVSKFFASNLTSSKPLINTGIIFGFFFTCGIGIYFGRYARWNSWEIITNPDILYKEFITIISNSYNLASMLSIGILFAAFLTLMYLKLFSMETAHNKENNRA